MTTAETINKTVIDFARHREHQYNIVIRKGIPVPQYGHKVNAITHIVRTMQAAQGKDVKVQCLMVLSLREKLFEIMPSESSRYKNMKRKIMGLISYASEQTAPKMEANGTW